ncbi:oxidoreductase [Zhongshania sp.]|uniref:oxidoreductase n=1 Tax=Zhongshania sp. TaxID=1971902 RepID=UPI0035654A25
MSNRVAVVTGANSGLGLAIAKVLAAKGYHVVMACRNLTKAKDAEAELKSECPTAMTTIIRLDLSDLDSVREFCLSCVEQVGKLDLLVNNAGIVAMPFERNKLGHEMQFATNYLGAFALVGQLLPHFKTDGECRIVNVGSLAHRFAKLVLDDLNWEKEEYKEMKGYGRSKIALMTFTVELNKRLNASGSNIIALAAHPGFANTNAGRSDALQPKSGLGLWFNSQLEKIIPTAADAARPILHAACADDIAGGDYYGPRGLFEIAGKPGKAKLNPAAKDGAAAAKLWTLSESLSGIHYLSSAEG